jgi:hypothetical protein
MVYVSHFQSNFGDMTEQHSNPSELPLQDGDRSAQVSPEVTADDRRRRLLALGAKGLFSGPILITLANRPAFGWGGSNCNYSAGASVNPSQSKPQGGDKHDVWHSRSSWPSSVGCNRTDSFASCFGLTSTYWNGSSCYVKVKNTSGSYVKGASLSLSTALDPSTPDSCAVLFAYNSSKKQWQSFNIGNYCRYATAAYLNEKHYQGSFPIAGCRSMVQNDFINKFATCAVTSSTTGNYGQFVNWNNNCI